MKLSTNLLIPLLMGDFGVLYAVGYDMPDWGFWCVMAAAMVKIIMPAARSMEPKI